MTHIDLFSGIGGFAYAARQVWPDYRNLFFCDNNTFCQAVLRKNFGQDSLIYGDIRGVNIERVIADTGCELRKQGYGELETNKTERSTSKLSAKPGNIRFVIDLLTGGFPCQPFSAAGKRKGRDDDRHLWPEMFRVIKTFKPRWVIGENVRGLVNIENGMALQQVFLDLESIEYAVQAFIIPACAVNAPHRRDRIWIVANQQGTGQLREAQPKDDGANIKRGRGYDPANKDRHAADAEGQGLEVGNATRPRSTGGWVAEHPVGNEWNFKTESWNRHWLDVAIETCSGVRRVHDGVPKGLYGFELTASKHREERLKALGNAIVPQVAIEIMRAIKHTGELEFGGECETI